MNARISHPNRRSRETARVPARADLDAMGARRVADVLGIVRAGAAPSRGGVPTGMWKTGWLAQPEAAA